jgi:hypothetical protein
MKLRIAAYVLGPLLAAMGCLWLVIGNYENPSDPFSASVILVSAALAGAAIGAAVVLFSLRGFDKAFGIRQDPVVKDGEIVLFFIGALFVLYELGATGAGTSICDRARPDTTVHWLACGK